MKNFNIFGAPPNIEGGLPEKRGGGLDSFQIWRGAWQERAVGVFEGGKGWYPNAHYATAIL